MYEESKRHNAKHRFEKMLRKEYRQIMTEDNADGLPFSENTNPPPIDPEDEFHDCVEEPQDANPAA